MDDILLIAPDGGWGWMIVLSDFMVNFIIDGVIGCFGLIYPELLTEFTSSASLTSMAGSLIVGTYMCSSRFIGRWVDPQIRVPHSKHAWWHHWRSRLLSEHVLTQSRHIYDIIRCNSRYWF